MGLSQCPMHMGIPKDQEGNAACRPSGPYLLPNYFLLRFLVYQKTALFSTSRPPLFVHLFVTDVTSQLFYLSGQKNTLLSLILFLNLDPPSRPKCDSWACGMNDFFIDEYKRECFKLKLPFLTSREMHFEMDSTVDAISVMPADRTLDILCFETTRHALLHYTQLHYTTHSFSIFFASKLLSTRHSARTLLQNFAPSNSFQLKASRDSTTLHFNFKSPILENYLVNILFKFNIDPIFRKASTMS